MKFGIAGVRSKDFTDQDIIQIANGYSHYLHLMPTTKKTLSCVIGYDTRARSQYFAELCADVLTANNIEVYLFSEPCPTPLLSYSILYYNCDGGLMLTASHNSKEYHGIKCYNSMGAQLSKKSSSLIEAFMEIPYKEFSGYSAFKYYLDDEVWHSYYWKILNERIRAISCDLNIAYSPLNGTGAKSIKAISNLIGVKNLIIPSCQDKDDPNFSTCNPPNPELIQSYNEVYSIAKQSAVPIDLIMLTDSDTDRLGVAILREGELHRFTANEIGCLLMDYVLRSTERIEDYRVAVSNVTIPLALEIASHYIKNNNYIKQTEVGFRYVVDAFNSPKKFFGFEESGGYLKGTYVKEKDAVLAFMLVVEMTAFYKTLGKTLYDALEDIYQRFGYFYTKTLLLPHCDYQFENISELNYSIIFRPSGTEDALKVYLTVWNTNKELAEEGFNYILNSTINSLKNDHQIEEIKELN